MRPSTSAGQTPTSGLSSIALMAMCLIGLGLVAGTVVILLGDGSIEKDLPAGRVVIVDSASQAVSVLPKPTIELTRPISIQDSSAHTVTALQQSLSSEFPTLKDAIIVCDQKCTLTVGASVQSDAQFAASQLPYMGRIEQSLLRRGLTPIDNLMIEEEGGDKTTLRLHFSNYD